MDRPLVVLLLEGPLERLEVRAAAEELLRSPAIVAVGERALHERAAARAALTFTPVPDQNALLWRRMAAIGIPRD